MTRTEAVGTAADAVRARPFERSLPPVVAAGMISLTFAIISGVVIVAEFGNDPDLLLPGTLAGAGILVEIVAFVMLGTISPFAWWRFRQVLLWALLAYVLQSGIIEWTFLINDVAGGQLVVLTAGLVVFATIVPVMIAFTVARYQAIGGEGPGEDPRRPAAA